MTRDVTRKGSCQTINLFLFFFFSTVAAYMANKVVYINYVH